VAGRAFATVRCGVALKTIRRDCAQRQWKGAFPMRINDATPLDTMGDVFRMDFLFAMSALMCARPVEIEPHRVEQRTAAAGFGAAELEETDE
jgi:hypothetical protein